MDLIKLKKLIEDFKSINANIKSPQPTFMDISGFPHYENVCSNILKFFFMTEESHGLKDLFVKALFDCIGEEYNHEMVVNDVIREQVTNKGNRIDIVVLSDDYVIGIENKIFAGVYNDFDDYSNYLEGVKNDRSLVKVILSIYPSQGDNSGFVNVQYSSLFSSIDNLIGNYWHNGEDKYLNYLKDFMETIRRIEGGTKMDSKLEEFIVENLDDVQNLLRAINSMKKNLRQKVQDLGSRIKYDDKICRQFFWRDNEYLKDDLVHDIQVGEAVVAIDTFTSSADWTIHIWLRKSSNNGLNSKQALADWLIGKGISKDFVFLVDQERCVYNKKHLTTDEAAITLQEILDTICK